MNLPGSLIHEKNTGKQTLQVYQQGNLRWLDFGDGAIQTLIDLEDASRLPSPVSRAMLAALLFIDEPEKVLLLGTGGGAIGRYFHNRCPTIMGDAVECSQAVADIAQGFFEFPDKSSGWRLIIADARDYIQAVDQQYNLIVLDIAEGLLTPPWVTTPDFLHQCRSHLTSGGVLVINMMPDNAGDFAQGLWNIRQIFDQRTVCLSVPEHNNILVFAFNGEPRYGDIHELQQHISTLDPPLDQASDQHWRLEFDDFLTRMQQENPIGSGIF